MKLNLSRNSRLKIELGVRSRQFDLSRISLVWLRDFELGTRTLAKNRFAHVFSLLQWSDALQLLINRLNCKWFPGNVQSDNFRFMADDRLKQLSFAKTIGFDIPHTIITNSPSAAKDFIYSHESDVVIKALHHHAVELGTKRYSMYTHRISKRDHRRLKDLIHAPCILQERLHKKSELRVTVVGTKIFAIELDSQSSTKGRDDWHRASTDELHVRPVEISNRLRERCIKFVNSIGLVFGAIDFVIDKDNRIVFLEVNPNASWLWIERITGLKITDAVVNQIGQMVDS